MLAFAHIPTGATANKGFDIDEVRGKIAEPASAITAIGADIETGGATLKSGSGCLTIGVHFSYGPGGVVVIVDGLFRSEVPPARPEIQQFMQSLQFSLLLQRAFVEAMLHAAGLSACS
jgi:hypothetical protein